MITMCDHGEPKGARYCALCKRDGMSAKIDAITQVSEHADGTWWAASMRAINHLAKTRDTFTADDVLELVEAQGYRTKENRAMGGVMRHAQTKEIIEIIWPFNTHKNTSFRNNISSQILRSSSIKISLPSLQTDETVTFHGL